MEAAWKRAVSSMASQPEVVDYGEKLFDLIIVTGRPAPSYQCKKFKLKKKEKYILEVTVGDEGPVEGGWADTFAEAEQQAAMVWLAIYQPNWKYKLDPSNNRDPANKGITATLYSHCESGNVDEVKAALRRGEDVNRIWQHGACGNPRCPKDPYCDFKATPLQGAIKSNSTDVIALLLQEPSINLNVRCGHNYTALNLACITGNLSIIRQLLKAPGIDPNIPNDFGRSPLLEAYFRKHQDCVEELLEVDGVNLPESLKDADGKPFDPWFRKLLIQARKRQENEKQRERHKAIERTRDAIEIEKQPGENVVENEREAKKGTIDMLIQAKQTTNPDQIEDEAQARMSMIEAGDQRGAEGFKCPDEADENVSESGHQQGQSLTPLPFGLAHSLVVAKVLPNSLLNLTTSYLDDCTLLKEQEDLQGAIENLAQLGSMLREGLSVSS